jgi:transcriptional regulator of acetoin/glycerol metabolism
MGATDPVRDALARTREAVLSGGTARAPQRDVVSRSWRRALAADGDPENDAPGYAHEPVRRCHPLSPALPLLRQTLVDIADQVMHLMIVTDEQGLILWREDRRDVVRRAERVGLENSIETNAMGTAPAADEAVTIHYAEHVVRTYHPWTCAAAPIHDPESDELIGAVDVTGSARTFHPTTLKLVIAAARLAECHLAAQVAVRDERLLARGSAHLSALRGEPGALLAPNGRVLAAQPRGWLPPRITLPKRGDRVRFSGGEGVLEPLAEGWLLRAAPTAVGALPPSPRRSSGSSTRSSTSTASRSGSPCAAPSR